MKFSTYLTKIAGVSMYPIISLVLFVCFFLLVSYFVFRMDKEEEQHAANLPLDN